MDTPNQLVNESAGWLAGGFGIAYAASKLRAMFASDSANIALSNAQQAASSAQQSIIEQLQKENNRLHSSVLELQQQVVALQQLVSDLTLRITKSEITEEQAKQIDELARQGKIERRANRSPAQKEY